MTATATTVSAAEVEARPGLGQFSTALRFSLREQARNRLAAMLLVVFVPVWYLLMAAMVGGQVLQFRLFSTGRFISVDGRDLTLVTAGMNALTMIVGFTVFAAVKSGITFDRRLVSAGYRERALIGAKALAVVAVALTVATYSSIVMLGFWRPTAQGWLAILLGFAVLASTYGAFGLFLGVLVRGDLEGFFLIIMVALMDTFLQNPLGNPLANKPVVEWFPSFGPMQFAVGASLGRSWLWGHLALGLLWSAGLAAAGLVTFHFRARRRYRRRDG
jgi:ABC-2 type transport system permease protein